MAGWTAAGIGKRIPASLKRAGLYAADDGGWGGVADTPSSLEETAWTIEALGLMPDALKHEKARPALERGTSWLIRQAAYELEAAPIGFYFAKLWYYEKLYPLIFATAALRRVRQILDAD